MLVGGGLALGGAALQAAFRNPLVSPQILGVSSGASFGGVLALIFGLGSAFLVGGAFLFGLVALGMVLLIGRTRAGGPILTIVLGGVVTSAFFSALVSFITYVADPYTTLPSIVFWLMGSLATADMGKVLIAAIPILIGSTVLIGLRWRINILSLGDDDATALGLNPGRLRAVLLTMVAFMTAGAVAVSGVIGWVGLVVPHMARLWVGPDHRISMPTTFVLGAAYLTIIDTLSRNHQRRRDPAGYPDRDHRCPGLRSAPEQFTQTGIHRWLITPPSNYGTPASTTRAATGCSGTPVCASTEESPPSSAPTGRARPRCCAVSPD
ncbi:UNVERIFIED_ORG: iron complex transport system permease protein [Gordonia westfalica J30]